MRAWRAIVPISTTGAFRPPIFTEAAGNEKGDVVLRPG
jgi:hypothetical protein